MKQRLTALKIYVANSSPMQYRERATERFAFYPAPVVD
jgi:hypothetical protein